MPPLTIQVPQIAMDREAACWHCASIGEILVPLVGLTREGGLPADCAFGSDLGPG